METMWHIMTRTSAFQEKYSTGSNKLDIGKAMATNVSIREPNNSWIRIYKLKAKFNTVNSQRCLSQIPVVFETLITP